MAGARASPPQSRPPQSAERATAKTAFEAKFKEPNPRLPFYITLGVLAAFALGTAGYFWYQLRPPTALVNANPPRPSGEQPVLAAAAAPAVPSAPTASAAPAQADIPGLPAAPASAPAVAAAGPAARSEAVVPAPGNGAAAPRAAIRAGFVTTIASRAFLTEAKKRKLVVNPLSA